MTLHDGDVAVLAQQAAGLLPVPAEARIVPHTSNDPYRWDPGTASWRVRFEFAPGGALDIGIEATMSPVDALWRLIDQLSEYGSEQSGLWGQAIPACPGHPHPAQVTVDGNEVGLTCPELGVVVARIRPDLPG
jgi:hypothetical protein